MVNTTQRGVHVVLLLCIFCLNLWSFERPNRPIPPDFLPGGAGSVVPGNIEKYTADSVTIIVYRIDLADTACPFSLSELEAQQKSINQMISEWSKGRFRIIFQNQPEVFSAPKDSKYYFENWNEYNDFCREIVTNSGVSFDDPGPTTRILTLSAEFGFNSSAAPPRISMAGTFTPWTVIHEMAHSLGLLHANGLDAGDNIIGTEDYDSENMEYGNVWGNMGIGYDLDFGPIYKNFFGWFQGDEIKHVTESEVVRLYPHDQATIAETPVTITLRSGNDAYTYWLEYRPESPLTREGVLFHLAGYLNNEPGHPRYDGRMYDTISYLLDMTPNSEPNPDWWGDDKKDAALTVGKSFTDPFGGFSLTVLGVNDGVWDENGWVELDIKILKTNLVEKSHQLSSQELLQEQKAPLLFTILGKQIPQGAYTEGDLSRGIYLEKSALRTLKRLQ